MSDEEINNKDVAITNVQSAAVSESVCNDGIQIDEARVRLSSSGAPPTRAGTNSAFKNLDALRRRHLQSPAVKAAMVVKRKLVLIFWRIMIKWYLFWNL